jgi:hypothetical protein
VSSAQKDPLFSGRHLSARGRIAFRLKTNGDQVQVEAEFTHMLILPDAFVLLLGWQQNALNVTRISLYQLLNILEKKQNSSC